MGKVHPRTLGTLLVPPLAVTLAATVVLVVRDDGGSGPATGSHVAGDPSQGGPAMARPLRGVQTRLDAGARRADGAREIRPGHFSQVAVTWPAQGPEPDVQVSTRTGGAWTRWTPLETLEDLDPGEGNGTRGTDLMPVGPSDALRVRVTGGPSRGVEVVTIDPGVMATDRAAADAPTGEAPAESAGALTLAAAEEPPPGSAATPPAYTPPARHAPRPFIRSRKAWGADETLRNGRPWFNLRLQQMHVHHTASSNAYTKEDVPGIIRGMYWYHTESLGWADLGYNFLIDRFGAAWQGRYGGTVTNVRGAHTLGFNHNSFGVAVIGNHQRTAPSRRALSKLVKLAAWKLDYYRLRPRGSVTATSQGSDRFPSGTAVRLRVIDGHRDTNETACPGRYLYEKIHVVRKRAQARADAY